ncbi:MAG: hypothetical protein GWN71_17955, partial [Gammaproteobacteria bacterium]|nr:hypothetical protein [Gammaproteobacteria bacterium]
MFRNLSLLALCLAFAALGCSESGELTQPVARDGTPTLAAGPSSATGGGHYLILFGLNLDTK